MEVVLLVVAVIGIALLVVPRLQRRRTSRARRPMSVKRRRAAAVAAAPAAVATWTPVNGSSGGADDDSWDDDLGWEGVEDPAPESRDAWERWRETESPLASAESTEAPELPSVERWRAAASDDTDWIEDDDGLGWEGEEDRAAGNGHGSHNGNGHAAPGGDAEPRVWVADAPAWNGNGARGREVAPDAQPTTAGFVAAAATAGDVAATRPDTGRVEGVEAEWKPAGREWGAASNGAAPVAAPAEPRKLRIHPVLLVAIYAAAGIGVVVMASTFLLGGSSSPEPVPAKQQAPQPAPTSAPQVTGSVADEPGDAEAEGGEAAVAAVRKARRDFARERTRAVRAERHAAAAKAAAARKKAAAAKKKKQLQQQSGGGGGATVAPQGGGATVAPQGGSSGGAGTRPVYRPPSRPTCEFCIG